MGKNPFSYSSKLIHTMVGCLFYKEEKRHRNCLSKGNENMNKSNPSYVGGGTREGPNPSNEERKRDEV